MRSKGSACGGKVTRRRRRREFGAREGAADGTSENHHETVKTSRQNSSLLWNGGAKGSCWAARGKTRPGGAGVNGDVWACAGRWRERTQGGRRRGGRRRGLPFSVPGGARGVGDAKPRRATRAGAR